MLSINHTPSIIFCMLINVVFAGRLILILFHWFFLFIYNQRLSFIFDFLRIFTFLISAIFAWMLYRRHLVVIHSYYSIILLLSFFIRLLVIFLLWLLYFQITSVSFVLSYRNNNIRFVSYVWHFRSMRSGQKHIWLQLLFPLSQAQHVILPSVTKLKSPLMFFIECPNFS